MKNKFNQNPLLKTVLEKDLDFSFFIIKNFIEFSREDFKDLFFENNFIIPSIMKFCPKLIRMIYLLLKEDEELFGVFKEVFFNNRYLEIKDISGSNFYNLDLYLGLFCKSIIIKNSYFKKMKTILSLELEENNYDRNRKKFLEDIILNLDTE